jgi:hypothetical protein
VFKNNHLYRMQGRIPENISFVEVTAADSGTGVGTPSPNSAISTEYGTFFYWNRGVYLYVAGQARKISDPLSDILEKDDKSAFRMGAVKEEEISLSYDPVSKLLFFSIDDSDLLSIRYGGEATFVFNVESAKWIGAVPEAHPFWRRFNVALYSDSGGLTASTFSSLIISGGERSQTTQFGLDSKTSLNVVDPACAGWMNSYPSTLSHVQFHPLIGELSPFDTKRFLHYDWLVDANHSYHESSIGGVVWTPLESQFASVVGLDGNEGTDTDTLTIDAGAVYADRIRHVFGGVGAETELQLNFDDGRHGEVQRVYEYAYAWQPMSKNQAGAGGLGGGFQF